MAARIVYYVHHGPAEETQRARATAMRQWIRVFLVLGRSHLMCDSVPADVKLHMSATFAAFMADCGAGVTADTIIGYLSHVHMWHVEHGHPDPRRPLHAAPAFTTADGSPATYDFLADGLRAALTEAGTDPSLYASHSFCSGGSTAAAAEGVPEYLIKL